MPSPPAVSLKRSLVVELGLDDKALTQPLSVIPYC